MIRLRIVCFSLLFLLGCTGVTSHSRSGGSSGRIPNVKLQTHLQENIKFYDDFIAGNIVLINFMYTSCDGL